MDRKVCCICHEAAEPHAKTLGGRIYCAHHHAKVTQNRSSAWRAGTALIGGQVGLVLLLELLLFIFKPNLSPLALQVVGLGLVLLSSLIWLLFFYSLDRLEPEPKGYVLGVFVLGALLARAVGIPLLSDLFEVQRWLALTPWVHFLGSVLVVGVTQEFLKYVAVRYTVYPLPEFDERVDGIIYGTTAGLGYAMMLNLHYVLASGGVNLQVAVIRIVVTALAQASFSGVSGYFLGRAKFEDEPLWWLPSGVLLAALLNGAFTTLRGELTTSALHLQGGGFNPWPGLILATFVALVTFAGLYYLLQRANKQTLSGGDVPGGGL